MGSIMMFSMLSAVALTFGACSDSGNGGKLFNPADTPYELGISAADFSNSPRIDNPFFPLSPGSRWVYEGDGERIEVEVLSETRTVMGIECVIVRDRVFEDGDLIEDTFDWYAQDDEGTVWYMGEDSHEIENGVILNDEGSWESGIDGAIPGILMLARPLPGIWYRQEFYAGEAEDVGQIIGINETVTVPAGTFSGVVRTLDVAVLAPKVEEHKFFARGVGFIKEMKVRGGSEVVELIEYTIAP